MTPDPEAETTATDDRVAPEAALTSVVHDYPDVHLPVGVEDWSHAARLQVTSGAATGSSSTPPSQVVAGDPRADARSAPRCSPGRAGRARTG